MTINMTPEQFDCLKAEITNARDIAISNHKANLSELHKRAREKFVNDTDASRAMRFFRDTDCAEVIDNRHINIGGHVIESHKDVGIENVEIARAVAACHIRNTIENHFEKSSRQLSDKQLAERYLSGEISEWEKSFLEDEVSDRYEERYGDDSVTDMWDYNSALEIMVQSLQTSSN